jgi:glycosyltransferase involved in cell wall biosynthesis
MACGLPVLCYNHGGQNDFLVDSTTGHLLELNDVDGFTERTRELARNAESRERMGKENLNRVEQYFIEHCAAEYERIFENAIRESRG